MATGSLILFLGPPCSGKSTLAAALAERRGLPHLQMDATRARILPDAPHTREDRRVAYRAMLMAAELLARHGVSAILDAPYGHAEDRLELAAVCERTAAPLYVVVCRVTVRTALARLAARGPDAIRKDLTPEAAAATVREYRYPAVGLGIDSERMPVEEALTEVEKYLAAARPADPARLPPSS